MIRSPEHLVFASVFCCLWIYLVFRIWPCRCQAKCIRSHTLKSSLISVAISISPQMCRRDGTLPIYLGELVTDPPSTSPSTFTAHTLPLRHAIGSEFSAKTVCPPVRTVLVYLEVAARQRPTPNRFVTREGGPGGKNGKKQENMR